MKGRIDVREHGDGRRDRLHARRALGNHLPVRSSAFFTRLATGSRDRTTYVHDELGVILAEKLTYLRTIGDRAELGPREVVGSHVQPHRISTRKHPKTTFVSEVEPASTFVHFFRLRTDAADSLGRILHEPTNVNHMSPRVTKGET